MIAPGALEALGHLRDRLERDGPPPAGPTPKRRRRKPAAGELVLRASVDRWSSGTPIRVIRGLDDGVGVLVETLRPPHERFVAPAWSLIHLRRGKPSETRTSSPAAETRQEVGETRDVLAPPPVIERDRRPVLVTATTSVLRAAERRGVYDLERRVEEGILAGRKRRVDLAGRRLAPGLRHVLVDGGTACVVEKLSPTGGGRRRFRAVHLLSVFPQPKEENR